MIAYVDSSVLLRLVLRQPGALKEWSSVEEGVTSALTQVECLRTLDRLRVVERIPDEDLASQIKSTSKPVGGTGIALGRTKPSIVTSRSWRR
jgi:predicted nucleic acid-binding protein